MYNNWSFLHETLEMHTPFLFYFFVKLSLVMAWSYALFFIWVTSWKVWKILCYILQILINFKRSYLFLENTLPNCLQLYSLIRCWGMFDDLAHSWPLCLIGSAFVPGQVNTRVVFVCIICRKNSYTNLSLWRPSKAVVHIKLRALCDETETERLSSDKTDPS